MVGIPLYCDQRFEAHATLEIEHVYPASWMGNHLNCGNRDECRRHPTHKVRFNHMEADLHNLYPAMAGMNGARSNKTFGIIPGEKYSLVSCDFETNSSTAEPRPGARGEIARAILYMRDEYGLPVDPALLETIQQWHQDDPPSTEEVWRNEMIFKLQRTRNRFIGD